MLWIVPALIVGTMGHRVELKSHLSHAERSRALVNMLLRIKRMDNVTTEERQLVNSENMMFYGDVKIGTPPQEFQVIFDTGSNDLWVPGPYCQSPPCKNHKKFFPKKSSTWHSAHHRSDLYYGTGDITADWGVDRVELGSVVLDHQPVGVTWEESPFPFYSTGSDGIMGLGIDMKHANKTDARAFNNVSNFSEVRKDLMVQFMDNCMVNNKLEQDMYGFYFSENPKLPGYMTLGKVFEDRIRPGHEMRWVKLTSPNRWNIEIIDVYAKGSNYGFCPPETGCAGLVDTGTTLITGPDSAVEHLTSNLNVDEDCDFFDQLPALSFVVRDADTGEPFHLELEPKDYVMETYEQGKRSQCAMGIMGSGMDLSSEGDKRPFWILGDVLIRAFYTVFDRKNLRVGFAKARHEGDVVKNSNKIMKTNGVSKKNAKSLQEDKNVIALDNDDAHDTHLDKEDWVSFEQLNHIKDEKMVPATAYHFLSKKPMKVIV